jgi:uncharacterized membrane protein
MNYYLFVATVSLALELAVLAFIIVGFGLKQHMSFRKHGFTMLTALVVHLISIGAVMVPSFIISLVPKILEKPTSLIGLFSAFHAALGTLTAILAIWIVCGWRLRQSTKFCAPKKKLMRATFILWLISLSLGIAFYFILNWSSLFG